MHLRHIYVYVKEEIHMESRLLFDTHWLLLSCLILITLSIWLLYVGIENDFFSFIDHTVLTWFHSIRSKFLDVYFTSITWFGSLWVLLPVYILLDIVFYKEHPLLQQYFGIVFFGTILTTYLIKYSLDRHRPHMYGVIGDFPLDPSFPSAHSAQITAFSIGLLLSTYQHSSLFIALVIFLGFIALSIFASRLYLQVHYPTDVIAGILIAIGWGIISYSIIEGNK